MRRRSAQPAALVGADAGAGADAGGAAGTVLGASLAGDDDDEDAAVVGADDSTGTLLPVGAPGVTTSPAMIRSESVPEISIVKPHVFPSLPVAVQV